MIPSPATFLVLKPAILRARSFMLALPFHPFQASLKLSERGSWPRPSLERFDVPLVLRL